MKNNTFKHRKKHRCARFNIHFNTNEDISNNLKLENLIVKDRDYYVERSQQ